MSIKSAPQFAIAQSHINNNLMTHKLSKSVLLHVSNLLYMCKLEGSTQQKYLMFFQNFTRGKLNLMHSLTAYCAKMYVNEVCVSFQS